MIATENNDGKQSILPRNSLSMEPQSMALERLPSNANPPEVAVPLAADTGNNESAAPAAGESKDAGPANNPELHPTKQQQEDEDELSGKLKTIQLTRPKVPVLKPFRMRTPLT